MRAGVTCWEVQHVSGLSSTRCFLPTDLSSVELTLVQLKSSQSMCARRQTLLAYLELTAISTSSQEASSAVHVPQSSLTMTTTVPLWLSKSYSTSHQKYLQLTLKQRETKRSAVRSLHIRGLEPPPNFRELFDYYSIAVACRPENEDKNRYVDIKPYDRTRVVLADEKGIEVLPQI